MFYTYIIRCKGNTLYTGITSDPKRRFMEHTKKSNKCAKYTVSHKAEEMVALWSCADRVTASRLEYRIKKLTKSRKEELIKKPETVLSLLDRYEEESYCNVEETLLKHINESSKQTTDIS